MKTLALSVFLILGFVAGLCANIAADAFVQNDVRISFTGENRFLVYDGRDAFSVDVTIFADTLFLPRDIRLTEIKLVVIQLDSSGKLTTAEIAPTAYNSRQLNMVVDIGGTTIVPVRREENYVIPDVIRGFELRSATQDTGVLLYLLPNEWHLIWRLKWNNAHSTFFSQNKHIALDHYTTKTITDVFTKEKVMFPNLERLYDVYRYIGVFENMNESLKRAW